jgi:hypothetical protein
MIPDGALIVFAHGFKVLGALLGIYGIVCCCVLGVSWCSEALRSRRLNAAARHRQPAVHEHFTRHRRNLL